MQSIQGRIVDRWPHWFSGVPGKFTRPLLKHLHRYTRLDRAGQFVAEHPHLAGLEFVEGALRHFDVRYCVDDLERQRIPRSGGCLIVANHPLGGLDALALLKMVGDVRRDVRIVANDFLMMLDGLRELLLPVRVFGGRSSPEALRGIDAALQAGAAVIVFPAGEVSRMGWRGIRDRPWRSGFLRYALRHQLPVIPVHVGARNGFGFYAGAALASPIGTALLPRQIFRPGQRRIEMRIGQALKASPEAVDGSGLRDWARRLQLQVERLKHVRSGPVGSTEAVAHPAQSDALETAIAGLEVLGETPDGKRILLAPPGASSLLLREVARLRELTFRAVGEGTGQALDWDRFDAWYDQLLLWDPQARRIIGAYRVGRSADIVARHGLNGLYTASLFDFDSRFGELLETGLELGRSFVVPDYWGTRSLDYLWFGIGAYLRRYPYLRHLFGTVSISAELPIEARDALVGYYGRYYGEPDALAQARFPYPLPAAESTSAELSAEQAFAVLKANLNRLGARVPTLYKQYTELCEPGGARFLAFGVDHGFNNAVDGLILVDLARLTPRKRQRYLLPRASEAHTSLPQPESQPQAVAA